MAGNLKALICAVVAAVLLVACGLSKEEIAETVKTSMQQTLSSDAQFKEFDLKVVHVKVIKQGDSSYKGLAAVDYEGEVHTVPVEITVDGSNVMWEAKPGAFMFVAQKQFQKLQQLFK